MTDRITPDVHEITWVGAVVHSLEPVPGVGTWEVVAHDGCPGNGRLAALTPGEPAPLCVSCNGKVRWRLAHLAPSVAADHLRAGRLP